MRKKQPTAVQKSNTQIYMASARCEKWVKLRLNNLWVRVLFEDAKQYRIESSEGIFWIDKTEVKDIQIR